MDLPQTTNLTNTEYRERMMQGVLCLDCKSHEVTEHRPQTSAWKVVIPMSCEDCGATWEEVFEFKGFQKLKL